MKKNKIRLTESQLHQVIKESVKKVLMEKSLDGIDYPEEDLIKVAEKDDYLSAYIDYLKEGWDDPSSAPSLHEFIQMIRNGEVRYSEDNNGIHYVNNY